MVSPQCRNNVCHHCTDVRCAHHCHNPDQGDLFGNSTLTGKGDTDTQRAGAAAALPTSGTNRRVVYDVLLLGPKTYSEIDEVLGWGYSRIGPRVRELVSAGLVEKGGTRPSVETGAKQDVWGVVR